MSNKHWNEFGRWLSACFAIVCVDILYEMSVQNGCNPHCMSSMQRFGWNRTMLFSFLMCNNWIVAWIEFNWLTFPIFMPSICAWADSRKKEEETGIEESYQNADIALISFLRDLKLNGRWISDWRQGKRRERGISNWLWADDQSSQSRSNSPCLNRLPPTSWFHDVGINSLRLLSICDCCQLGDCSWLLNVSGSDCECCSRQQSKLGTYIPWDHWSNCIPTNPEILLSGYSNEDDCKVLFV